jgi:small subunit ribosomal protein S16
MLVIRLSRIGKKKNPIYRLIISEKARDPYGKALEILGTYNPFTKELISKNERITYWLSKGAQMSASVNNLLIEKKIIKGNKVKASKVGKKQAEEQASEEKVEEKEQKPEGEKTEVKESEEKVEEKK